MEKIEFHNLSLPEKEDLVKEKGQLIEAQDFYSFFVLVYLFEQHPVKVIYDFSGQLIDIADDIENESEDQFSTAVNRFLH